MKISERALAAHQAAENMMYEMIDLKSHVSYVHMKSIVDDRVASLNYKIRTSNDPNEVFACVKEKNGIMFLIDEVDHLIETGKASRKYLLKVKLD